MERPGHQKRALLSLMIALFIAAAPIDLRAQTDETEENVTVTHGGYSAFGGALAFAIFSAGTLSFARLIYAPPLDADCDAEPQRCKPNALDHTLVGLAVGASVTGVYFSGWGAQKFAESKEWDAPLGWALSGGYLGLPITLLLQNAIPNFSPDWLRQTLGLVLAAGGSFGAGYAFREFALQRGHAWPEFGFGAGGLAAGLTVGTLVARDTVWAPIIGGLTSVAAASVAHFAFPP